MRNKYVSLTCAILIGAATLVSAERLTKSVTFKSSVGVSPKGRTVVMFENFGCRLLPKQNVQFTWSARAAAKVGELSIYSLSGVLVKRVSVDAHVGKMIWSASKSGVSNGVYIATMEIGSYKHDIKFNVL